MGTRAGLDQHRVIQAAARLADEQGLATLTLASLAQQLGVRPSTLYHYVTGLPGLRRELALLGTRELAERAGCAVMGKAGEEAVQALAFTYRRFIHEHPGLYEATIQAATQNDRQLEMAQNEVLEIARRALSAYRLADEDAIHAVRMLRSMVHGFTTLERSGGFGLALDLEETFHRLLSLFLQSLAEVQRDPKKGDTRP